MTFINLVYLLIQFLVILFLGSLAAIVLTLVVGEGWTQW
jgi:hypothetical protein